MTKLIVEKSEAKRTVDRSGHRWEVILNGSEGKGSEEMGSGASFGTL